MDDKLVFLWRSGGNPFRIVDECNGRIYIESRTGRQRSVTNDMISPIPPLARVLYYKCSGPGFDFIMMLPNAGSIDRLGHSYINWQVTDIHIKLQVHGKKYRISLWDHYIEQKIDKVLSQ